MKEAEGNMARERAASWAVWGWERCTLPGTLMNALQASSLPCSPQQCGFHAYANHALWDSKAQSWWKETCNTVNVSKWLHCYKMHTLHSYIIIITTTGVILTISIRSMFLYQKWIYTVSVVSVVFCVIFIAMTHHFLFWNDKNKTGSKLSFYINHSGPIKLELLIAKPEQEGILNNKDLPCHDISKRVRKIRLLFCLPWNLICSASVCSPSKGCRRCITFMLAQTHTHTCTMGF